MTHRAASQLPALAPQGPIARPQSPLGLSLSVIPLPVGELAMLLSAWLLMLTV
jgi:hypothetical protein